MNFGNFLNIVLLNELNEVNERHQENVYRRSLRDQSNPFQMREKLFMNYFRLSKATTLQLIELLRPHLQTHRVTAVPMELKVLTLLPFLGQGSYQRCIGSSYNLGLHQTTVSKIIEEVSNAIVIHLLPQSVAFPKSEEQRNTVKQGFYEKFGMPGVIGAIDCTHIAIVAPASNDPVRPALAYYNRKGFYSINVQMICDENLKILECNARFPGATHDSAIWSLCAVKMYLEQNYNNHEIRSTWLIGDSGYPLQPWLLTPVQDAEENTVEERYNRAHCLARNCVERTFGILKQRFRCLLKHRTLHYGPVKAGKIIYSCVVLHNMALAQNVPLPDDNGIEPDLDVAQNGHEENENGQVNVLVEGRRVREDLIRRYF